MDSSAPCSIGSSASTSSGQASSSANSAHAYLWLWAVLTALTCGCQSISYYTQAIRGQCQILNRQEPINAVLMDPTTPESVKENLSLAIKIRTFAEVQLLLPANGHYRKYADLKRPFAVWNVYAAPEFSVEPKSWWYPAVGRLEYRGYFSEAAARRYADQLAKEGFDVHVAGVAAYSTLGWFRDPLLNTFIDYGESDLAELIFHELGHQRLFAPGETDFNEAFATAVAEEGLRRWLHARKDPAAEQKHHLEIRRTEEFVNLVAEARSRLERLFARAVRDDTANLGTEEKRRLRAGKQQIVNQLRSDYAQLKDRWGGRADYDRWFSQSLNNAQLNTIDTYYNLVPAFRALLAKCNGNLGQFYSEAESISKLKKEDREMRLKELIPAQATAVTSPTRNE